MARFADNIRKANDDTKSIKDRAVNLRSCAVNLSQLAKCSRSNVMDELQKQTGVDLNKINSVKEIQLAIDWMILYREKLPGGIYECLAQKLILLGWMRNDEAPCRFNKDDFEIVFDTSTYVEMYSATTRVAEGRVHSVQDLVKLLENKT